MRTKALLMLAAAVCLPLVVGCSKHSQTVRSQSPEMYTYQGPAYGPDCYADDCDDDCYGSHCHCRPYCLPNDLVYPPPGDAPAIVQYPYYTNKGPDCFFFEK